MNIIYAQQNMDINGRSVFLAGPTPRSKSLKGWREEAIKFFKKHKFEGTLIIPETEDSFSSEFAYSTQIDWEQEYLEKADIILFWVDRSFPNMPAFTTNIEYGYWLAKKPSKIMLGIPEGAPKVEYIKYTANKNNIEIENNLETLIIKTLKGD